MPALRAAWLVAQAPLAGALAQATRNLGLGANLHAQAALAEVMESGGWRAHIRRIAAAHESGAGCAPTRWRRDSGTG